MPLYYDLLISDIQDFQRNPVENVAAGYDPKDTEGHGTRMADLVGGAWAGVAKNAQVVNVKFGSSDIGDPRELRSRIYSAWAAILWDVEKNKRQGKAVISLSSGTSYDATLYSQDYD
jgi:hypothetical protein